MGERTRQAVEVIGDVAKKAKDAVMIPLHGAYALAKAVVGAEEEQRRDDRERRRQDRHSTKTKSRGAAATTTGSPSTSSTSTGTTPTPSETSETTSEPDASLDDIWGVGESRADDLRDAGFGSVQQVADATVEDLSEVSGIGDSTAQKMIDSATDLLEE